ncbi:hypothetical protein DQK91_18830 [Oceanidesulfovibrio marinus]|uniref:Scaffolding protein n=2 Tax=Oceanidesulfovibrio marinus TaxID=370038 RepID=A0A6P1ZD39_9BACT|nr:hypothetical protein DQK91_18830 [Oceanidesulfovibrio marinus]
MEDIVGGADSSAAPEVSEPAGDTNETGSAGAAEVQGSETGTEDKGEPKAAAQDGGQDGSTKDEVKDGEDKLPPFHEHPRWKQLLASNKAMQKQLETLLAKNDKPEAAVPVSDFDKQLKELDKKYQDGEIEDLQDYLSQRSEIVDAKGKAEFDAKLQEAESQRTAKETVSRFKEQNPDYAEAVKNGELDEIIEKWPGLHDEFSAYHAWKAQQATAGLESAKQAEYQRGLKDGEEKTIKNFKAKQGARSLDTGPRTTPREGSEADTKLKDTQKHGGLVDVLTQGLKEFRESAG